MAPGMWGGRGAFLLPVPNCRKGEHSRALTRPRGVQSREGQRKAPQVFVLTRVPAQGDGAMAEGLPKEQVDKLHEAFNRLDTNGDGTICVQELGNVMQSLGHKMSEEELKNMIHQVDKDGDGKISFPEFLEVMTKKLSGRGSEAEMREVFQVFDVNGDGRISVDELRQAMAKLGETLSQEELDAMIREADVDQDGQVSYEEFMKILSQK